MLELRAATSQEWLTAVLCDFDAFLLDHAACERKASANAVALVTHYPDRRELVATMIELAREELEHFQRIWRIIDARGLVLADDRRDPYLRGLRAHVRSGREDYFLDRLLVGGIAEARGCERFGLVAGSMADLELRALYESLSLSEARHGDLFVELSVRYFERDRVAARLGELLDVEACVLSELPISAALH